MEAGNVIQGRRRVTSADMEWIRSLLSEHSDWNRSRLSRELCVRWDWRNGKGRLKDMAARTLLLKLERMGEIRLPIRQRPGRPNRRGFAMPEEMAHDRSAVAGDLSRLRPLRIDRLGAGDRRLDLFKYLLHRYHYLGHQCCVGENLKLMVSERSGRLLACLLFGSAAWKVKSRDGFIGWDRQARERNLSQLTNNTRFLILPWVQVPHLASHLLSRICRDLPGHWIDAYGHGINLIETFVERDRFRGTCYRAAGWVHAGATAGRSRNDVDQTLSVPVKEVFLYPLHSDFRRRLCMSLKRFDPLVGELKRTLAGLPDKRTGENTRYSMETIGLSAFSVFFTQSPSFLAHQSAMEKNKGKSNARTLFQVEKTPSDNHIRDMLDPVEPQAIYPVYDCVYEAFREQGILETFRAVHDTELIALDGTWYFSSQSDNVKCKNCSTIQHKNGEITRYHSFVCKPDSHKHLCRWVDLLEPVAGIHTVEMRVKNKKNHSEAQLRPRQAAPFIRAGHPKHPGLPLSQLPDLLRRRLSADPRHPAHAPDLL